MKATTPKQNQSPMIETKRAIGLVMAVLLLAAPTVFAASATWNGTTDATWAGTGNWSAAPIPGTGDAATFNNAGNANTTIDLGGGVTISNLTFDTSSAAAYTLGTGAVGSQTLTIDNGSGGIIVSPTVANNQLVNANLVLGTNTAAASYTLTNGSSQSLTIAGSVTGGAAGGTAGVKTLTILNSGSTTLSGNISKGGATAVTLVKNGTGTLALSGTDSLVSGAFNVNAGTVNLSGALTNSGAFTIGSASAQGRLNLSGTSAITNNVGFFNIGTGTSGNGILNIAAGDAVVFNGANGGNFGGSATSSGLLYNDGTFLITGTAANNCGTYVGNSTTAYGYFRNAGTATVSGRVWVGQGSGALGVLDIAGGTFTVGGTNQGAGFQLAANSAATASSAGVNVTAGTLALSQAQNYTVNTGNNNYSAINITGAGKLTLPAASGMNLGNTANANNVCTVTLASGGELDAAYLWKNGSTASAILNFNGGTVKATSTDASGIIQSSLTAVYVYSSGATFDGSSARITAPLLAPTADGVSTYGVTGITLGGTTSGYIGAPLVKITGGGGQGAAAIANFNPASGTITSITVTAPGSGYTSAPTITLAGGNGGTTGSAAGTATATASIGAAASGGLTKIGAGTLTLAAPYSYTGTTKVLGGTLSLNSSLGVPATGGDLVISNATLTTDASGGTAIPAANVTFNNGAILNLTNNAGAYAINGTGSLLVESNTTMNLNYGTLGGNPTAAAINVAGGISVTGTTNVINVTGSGFVAGSFPLIDYTGTPLASLTGFKLGTLPPGVNATLLNNTANSSIDLNITFIGQTLAWYGADAVGNSKTNWDINTSTNWNVGAAKYLEYGTSPNFFGDLATFDDTLFNQQGTNVNLATTLRPSLITVNSSLPYSFTGTGSLAGVGSLTMSGSGSLTLGTSNNYTGGTIINAGTVIITNDFALGTNSGSLSLGGGTLQIAASTASTRPVSLTADSTVSVLAGASAQLGGAISGSGSLTKTDNGTLILAGSNPMTGAVTNSGGTLVLASSNTIAGALTLNAGVVTVATNSTLAGVVRVNAGTLNITSGTTKISNAGNPNLFVGSAGLRADLVLSGTATLDTIANNANFLRMGSGGIGVVNNSSAGSTLNFGGFGIGFGNGAANSVGVLYNSGTFNAVGGGNAGLYIGNNDNAYGYLRNSGTATATATVAIGNNDATTGNGAIGVLDVTGGTMTLGNAGNLSLNYFANRTYTSGSGYAQLNVTGGTLTFTNAGTVNLNRGGNLYSSVNITGAGKIAGLGATGFELAVSSAANNVATLALANGGTLETSFINKAGALSTGVLTFDNGTLRATATDGTALVRDSVITYVQSGGATIDSGSFSTTVASPLLAPVGDGVTTFGVTSITLGGTTTGYVGSPVVQITGDGVGAAAVAGFDPTTGTITGITVTSPGSGYTFANITLAGGGAATATATANLGAVSSGGLVKAGSGTLTLSGANTYTGVTVVTNGELFLTPAHQAGAAVVVANNAKFGVSASSVSNSATIGALTLGSSGATTLDFSYGFAGNPTNVALSAGAVAVSGTSSIRIGGTFAVGVFPVLKYTSLSGSFSSAVAAPRGVTATVSNDTVNKTLYVSVTSVGGGIVWSGTNNLSPNLWDLNTTTNWLTGSTPTIYIENVPPGDAVTFNDSGSGTVLLSNTASPASLTISNAGVNYTFQGSGGIGGSAGLTKIGSGSVTMSLAGNSYAGNTVVSNGTFQLGAANVMPDGSGKGSLILNGTLDLNTFSDTVNNLSGSGSVDTIGGGTPVLTVNSGADSAFSGVLLNTAGALGLTKTGNSTLTLSGVGTSAISQLKANAGLLKIANGTLIVATSQGDSKVDAGGTLEVTTGGALVITNQLNSWFPIGDTASTASTLTLSGGTVTVTNNWGTQVGRLGSGTLNINSGTFINHDIGAQGLMIGEGTGVTGTVNLNGGNLVINRVRSGNGANTIYFNGGVLKANESRTDFIPNAGSLTAYVSAGGAVVDTAGFNDTIASGLVEDGSSPGGGLTKSGAGTLTLSGANSYTGLTTLSNGTLQVDGSINAGVSIKSGATLDGIGTIGGAVTNEASGIFGASASIGTLTINGDITLKAGSTNTFAVNGTTPANDDIVAGANVNYGGVLNIVPGGTFTVGQSFTLFSGAGAVSASNFASIAGSPGSGLAFTFTNGVLSVVTGVASYSTNITATVNGSSLEITWPSTHLGWMIEAQTNTLNVGLSSNWFTISNTASVLGYTNVMNPANGSVFYRLRQP